MEQKVYPDDFGSIATLSCHKMLTENYREYFTGDRDRAAIGLGGAVAPPLFFRDRSKNFYKYGIFKFTHLNVSMTAKKVTHKQIYMSTVVTLARRNQGH